MATQVLPALLRDTPAQAAPAPSLKPEIKDTLLRRLFDAFTEAQMRRAHREIARVMDMKCLHFTPGSEPDRRFHTAVVKPL